mmetsp:Transcript_3791/g.8372  ORF Transcript_3791/g.8372 Transcript_3791/m.8372 type:complete len:315 (+) Transcript_3791:86-1030(+)
MLLRRITISTHPRHKIKRCCRRIAQSTPAASHHTTCNESSAAYLAHYVYTAQPKSSKALCPPVGSSAMAVNSIELGKQSTLHRSFATAYQGTPCDGKRNHQLLTHLIPYQSTLKDGRRVEVDFFRHSSSEDIEEDEWFAGMALMNLVIREGRSWPFEEEFGSVDDWRDYFLSHTAFVVRALDNGMDSAKRNSSSQGEILGCFYIKPNFPGRCSHVCNGGFITAPRFRGLGIGRLMGKVFLRAARDLGYKSSYFDLVFSSNVGSVKLWESLGFMRVATLENAARLEGLEYLDTAFGYRYDLENLPADYLGVTSNS